MGMDVDYLAARQAIDKLEKILSDTPHGKREKIADEIIEFVDKLEKRKNKKNSKNNLVDKK